MSEINHSQFDRHLPFGGHGHAGPSISSFRGGGYDTNVAGDRVAGTLAASTSAIIKARVRVALWALSFALLGLFGTVTAMLVL